MVSYFAIVAGVQLQWQWMGVMWSQPFGGDHKRKLAKSKLAGAQASPRIPWRSLPYLRKDTLADIRAVADTHGNDL